MLHKHLLNTQTPEGVSKMKRNLEEARGRERRGEKSGESRSLAKKCSCQKIWPRRVNLYWFFPLFSGFRMFFPVLSQDDIWRGDFSTPRSDQDERLERHENSKISSLRQLLGRMSKENILKTCSATFSPMIHCFRLTHTHTRQQRERKAPSEAKTFSFDGFLPSCGRNSRRVFCCSPEKSPSQSSIHVVRMMFFLFSSPKTR
jgi:hypothetical protein